MYNWKPGHKVKRCTNTNDNNWKWSADCVYLCVHYVCTRNVGIHSHHQPEFCDTYRRSRIILVSFSGTRVAACKSAKAIGDNGVLYEDWAFLGTILQYPNIDSSSRNRKDSFKNCFEWFHHKYWYLWNLVIYAENLLMLLTLQRSQTSV